LSESLQQAAYFPERLSDYRAGHGFLLDRIEPVFELGPASGDDFEKGLLNLFGDRAACAVA
jgi:hypothetical protein